MTGMEEEIIFHIRGVIQEDTANISDSKRDEKLCLGRKESFDELFGQVHLYSLTRENVLTPEVKEKLNTELEEYKRHPLEEAEILETITHEERQYTSELVETYAQAEKANQFSLDDIADYPKYQKHLAEQRRYYFVAEAVRRGTRDIYKQEEQFNILKAETYEGINEYYEDPANSGLDRLKTVLKRAVEINLSRCCLCRDTD